MIRRLQLLGWWLWMVGCVTFAVSAARAGDAFAFSGAALFAVGIVAFLVAMRLEGRESPRAQRLEGRESPRAQRLEGQEGHE